MAKEAVGFLKLQVKGGSANPAPPIGPALGSKGLNIMDFCKQFNARSQDKPGQILPVLITIFLAERTTCARHGDNNRFLIRKIF